MYFKKLRIRELSRQHGVKRRIETLYENHFLISWNQLSFLVLQLIFVSIGIFTIQFVEKTPQYKAS